MRELKFRAYDKENYMFKDVTPFCDDSDKLKIVIFEDDDYDVHVVEFIEQYTGLKDIHDKEIYEGDIIGVEQEYSDESGKEWTKIRLFGVVSFEKGEFGVWGNPLYGNETKHFHDLADGQWIVLGNIHKNKKLLNEN